MVDVAIADGQNPPATAKLREEEPRIPGCFMNIEPPHSARRKIVKAAVSHCLIEAGQISLQPFLFTAYN